MLENGTTGNNEQKTAIVRPPPLELTNNLNIQRKELQEAPVSPTHQNKEQLKARRVRHKSKTFTLADSSDVISVKRASMASHGKS